MNLRPEGSQSLRLKGLQDLRPEGNFVSAPEDFESEERWEKQFAWQLRKATWHEKRGRSTCRRHLSSSWSKATPRRLPSFSINIGSLCRFLCIQLIVQIIQYYSSTRCVRKNTEKCTFETPHFIIKVFYFSLYISCLFILVSLYFHFYPDSCT